MAVENDYNLLVSTLNDLAETTRRVREEVQERLLREKRDGLEPNETRWVQLIIQWMPLVSGPSSQLEHEAGRVLRSRPGEAVVEDQPPLPPDAPPLHFPRG